MTFDTDPVPTRRDYRPWMAGAAVAVVAAAGLGFALLGGPASDLVARSGQMQVEVVAPVEPDVQPGGTMEVGDLVDGYAHVAIQPQAAGDDVYDPDYQTAWVEPAPPVRAPVTTVWRSDVAVVQPTAVQAEVTRSDGRYGFDGPSPDYAAERRARQERLDRVQAEQASRGVAGAPVGTPALDRESAFY